MAKILIIDTNIMCVWLKVPGRETAGKENEWTYDKVSKYIDEEIKKGTKLCLPITSVIETGNHIAHVRGNRENAANAFADIIEKSASGETPWIVFDQQNYLWEKDKLQELAKEWCEIVKDKEHAFGDAIIVKIAEYYSPTFDVEIFTADQFLKEFERKIVGRKEKNILSLRRNRHGGRN